MDHCSPVKESQMYMIHYKKATAFEDLRIKRFEDRSGAESATFDLPEDRSAQVVGSDNDLIKNLWGMKELVALYNAMGQVLNTQHAEKAGGGVAQFIHQKVERFHDVPTARQRVMMRLVDVGKDLPLSQAGNSDQEWFKKKREGDIKAASEMYLGAADDFTRQEAERKLARLGVPVPSLPKGQVKDEEQPMAKAKSKKAAKSGGSGRVKVSPKGEAFVDLPRNLVPPETMKVGLYCRSLIMAGKATEEIVQLAKKYFKSATNAGHVSWYRRDLRERGVKNVPAGREKAAE